MKNSLITLFLLLSVTIGAVAQPSGSKADSLLSLIKASKSEDTNKVNLMMEYFRCLFPQDIDSAFRYSQQIMDLSKKLTFQKGFILALNGKALCEWYGNDPRQAVPTFREVFSMVMKQDDEDLQALVLNNIGVYYMQMGISDTAEKYQSMAVTISKRLPDKKRFTKASGDLGMIYVNKGKYVEAIQNFLEVKHYYEINHNLKDLINTCIRLGIVYQEIGDFDRSVAHFHEAQRYNAVYKDKSLEQMIYSNLGVLYTGVNYDSDSALFFLDKSLAIARSMPGQEISALISLVNLGNVAIIKKDFRLALDYYLQVHDSPLLLTRNYERIAVLVNLGVAYNALGDYKQAEQFALQGVKLANENKFLKFKKIGLETLANIAAGKNDFKKAFTYKLQADSLQDSIWNEDIKKKVTEATFHLALAQKENENSILLKDNELKQKTIYGQRLLVGGTVAILVLLIALIVVVYRNQLRLRRLNLALDAKNKELSESNTTKDKFFSIIAHDLKSPFTTLLGYLTLLNEDYAEYGEQTRRDIINKLTKSSHNTYNLLVNLLDWSQSQRTKIECIPEDIQAANLLDEVISSLASRAGIKNLVLKRDILPDLVIHADPRLLKAVLTNLINNSVKFTQENGEVTVRMLRLNGETRIEVADNGIGIPADQIDRLFRIDSQFKRLGTNNEPGTGLGLIMCQEFITLLGGTIRVESAEGAGSRFIITIPDKNHKMA